MALGALARSLCREQALWLVIVGDAPVAGLPAPLADARLGPLRQGIAALVHGAHRIDDDRAELCGVPAVDGSRGRGGVGAVQELQPPFPVPDPLYKLPPAGAGKIALLLLLVVVVRRRGRQGRQGRHIGGRIVGRIVGMRQYDLARRRRQGRRQGRRPALRLEERHAVL